VKGRFKKHVSAKDLILHLIGRLTAQGANFKVLEFHGDTIRKMPTSGRLVLCNMSVEAGPRRGSCRRTRRRSGISARRRA